MGIETLLSEFEDLFNYLFALEQIDLSCGLYTIQVSSGLNSLESDLKF